jgi:uncharacterized phage protein (TIGR02216 family)
MRLTPDTFWAMSLSEWRAAVNGFARRSQRATPLARSGLEHLMQMYPDSDPPRPTQWGRGARGEGVSGNQKPEIRSQDAL